MGDRHSLLDIDPAVQQLLFFLHNLLDEFGVEAMFVVLAAGWSGSAQQQLTIPFVSLLIIQYRQFSRQQAEEVYMCDNTKAVYQLLVCGNTYTLINKNTCSIAQQQKPHHMTVSYLDTLFSIDLSGLFLQGGH